MILTNSVLFSSVIHRAQWENWKYCRIFSEFLKEIPHFHIVIHIYTRVSFGLIGPSDCIFRAIHPKIFQCAPIWSPSLPLHRMSILWGTISGRKSAGTVHPKGQ